MNIEIPPNKYNNLTRKERSTLYNLINDKKIVIKSTNKGSAVVFWNRDCYIKEADKQVGDKDIYEVGNDFWTLISITHKAIEKNRKRGHLNADTIKYFMIKDPTFARFYLLPKMQPIAWRSRWTCYLKLRLLCWKHIFFFRLWFATFGPGRKILNKR